MERNNKKTLILIFSIALVSAVLFFYRLNGSSEPADTSKNNAPVTELSTLPPLSPNPNFSDSNDITSKNGISDNPVDLSKTPETVALLKNQDLKMWQTFESLLASNNDNDPRLDSDLKKLSSLFHIALYEKYDLIPDENRNQRGLVTFLVARDLNSVADAEFLKTIFMDPPCLSLADCKKTAVEDSHHSAVNQTTLNYPQLAALYQLEKRIDSNPDLLSKPDLREGIIAVLRQATTFPVPAVQNKAQQILTKYKL